MSISASSVFTGSSTYSSDFQQVISRAQQIASLPITQLSNEKDTLTAEQKALNSVSSTFSSLQASLLAVDSAVRSGTQSVSNSDNTVAGASVGSGAALGTYTLQVVDPGTQASATSTAGVADPTTASIASAASFRLIANGREYDYVTPASNSLNDLASAINAATSGAVQATVVNMGTTSAPLYKLSLQNTKYGDLGITLDDGNGGANLMGTATTGTSVQYRVNGQPGSPATLSSDTRTITLAPNITATALTVGTTSITVSQSTSNIADQISAFVKSYNGAQQALDAQRGPGAGPLSGLGIINTLSQSLRGLTNYTGPGTLQAMSDIGLTFDQTTYQLTFDPTVLSAAASKNFKNVTDFLGSSTTGGFLKAANDTLNSVTDSSSGAIPTTLLTIAGQISDDTNRIAANQARVDLLTQNLNAQMAAADALIASMQQQALYFTNMFSAMQTQQNSMR